MKVKTNRNSKTQLEKWLQRPPHLNNIKYFEYHKQFNPQTNIKYNNDKIVRTLYTRYK